MLLHEEGGPAADRKMLFGISANILILGVVSFFTDISSELVLAVLPTFLVMKLGATPLIIGSIEGAAESLTSFLKLFSGAIADKTGKRKGLAVLGYGLSNAVKPFLGFAFNWESVLFLRMSDRVGKGIRTPPRDAIIADSCEEAIMGRSFGIHRTLDQLGAVVGPVLAFLLLAPLGYNNLFIFTAIPGVIAVIILIVFVKDPCQKSGTAKYSLKNARKILDRKFTLYLSSATLYSISAFTYALILLRALQLGLPDIFIPLVYAAIQVCHAMIGYPAGLISDRHGRARGVQIGYFVLFVSFVFMALSSNIWMLLMGALLFGAHQGIVETTQRAMIPSLVPENMKGTAYGIYNTAIGITNFPTNFIAAYLFTISYSFAFTYGAIFALMASLLMIFTQRAISGKKAVA
jgi:MFS family permease